MRTFTATITYEALNEAEAERTAAVAALAASAVTTTNHAVRLRTTEGDRTVYLSAANAYVVVTLHEQPNRLLDAWTPNPTTAAEAVAFAAQVGIHPDSIAR